MRYWLEKLKNPFRWLRSWFWVLYYGYPAKKLTVIAVTGTDGKTTVVSLIYEILKAAGFRAGMVSTVGGRYIKSQITNPKKQTNSNDQKENVQEVAIEMGLHVTTPDEDTMQRIFREMVEAGCTHAVIEVTSHRLAQYKTEGYNVEIAVLTNITHEHLDYHGTFEEYRNAKLKLFKNVQYSVLNQDDPSFDVMKDRVSGKLVTYGKGYSFKDSPFLAGEYNKYNIGAAAAVAKILDVRSQIVEKVVRDFAGVPGRREEIKMGQKFRCIVDFAHTPNGLKNLLESLKGRGRLILVFGCTGERDKDKRPIMGKVADELAEVVIVTTDDVRNESQDEIYKMIVAGMKRKPLREDDRDKAIEMAVKMAKEGDIVVAAGMGHEQTQLIGKSEISRSDREAFIKGIMGIHAAKD